ncbi:hypothetical protein Tsubulata_009707 [Turnera subulata]|uniref:C2H2-type domain-containing protein n=1 Tax=Turnera subulata TaxID=218843 RepID=A0A9Q0F5G0_9ROSI|nr:hypothetical protein Tsubulata_009707 [Turnera subulata]
MAPEEEFMGSNDVTQIIKGKRTKRQRSSSPYKVALTSSSSSGYGDGGVVEEYGASSSPTTSSVHDHSTDQEEEDMAECLILLAQGDRQRPIVQVNHDVMEKFVAPRFSDMATPTINKAGFYVYECKTCNRSFPSFQALGGHRASHKKPKPIVEDKKSAAIPVAVLSSMDDVEDCHLNKSSSDFISLQIANNNNSNSNSNKGSPQVAKPKIHECSICGSEFTSGQALGGHMRRHRANTGNKVEMMISSVVDTSFATAEPKVVGGHRDNHQIKPRNILTLDLNLPAPEDDHHHRESKFQFVPTQQALVFSAPALVDCHY